MTQPITIYAHRVGPNPWKVIIIFEELGLPYNISFKDMSEVKQEPYEQKNPNGRLPTIEDPNTGITLWESGAIIQYLLDEYDKDNKLSYGDKTPEKYVCNQWLMFQMSTQGPYYGQKAWFSGYHPEKNLTSAIDRYANEMKRIIGVIDRHLAKTGTQWLVGSKCTYSDLSFVTWDMVLPLLLEGLDDVKKSNPHWTKWHEALMSRPAVKKVVQDKGKALAAGK